MSAYVYITTDQLVTDKPCKLLSVCVGNDGGNTDSVVIYDEQSAVTGREVATLVCGGNTTIQVRWQGLELSRGLYVDLGTNIEYVTVEWEPVGYPEDQGEWVRYLKESES